MSLDMSEKCHEMPTRSSENSQLVGTECLESSLQDTDTGKLQGVCGKDKLGNIIESCTSKKWGAFEALLQMSPIGAAIWLFQSMWHSSQKMVLSCVHGADMSRYVTWYVGEMPRNANSFQWEFPACWNRMSWKQSAGHRCREAARCMRERQIGKHFESCISKKWGDAIRPHKWGTFMRPKSRYVTWYFRQIPTCSSEKSHQPMFRLQKGLEGPSHVSPAWNRRSRRKSRLKTRCPWM